MIRWPDLTFKAHDDVRVMYLLFFLDSYFALLLDYEKITFVQFSNINLIIFHKGKIISSIRHRILMKNNALCS